MLGKSNQTRRNFLKNSIKSSIVSSIGIGYVGSILESCTSSKAAVSNKFSTSFEQMPLPYSFNALENVVDSATMEIHYTRHAAAYAKNIREAALAEGINTNNPIEDVLRNVSKYSAKVRNNAGGHYNHEMFWKCMRPKTENNLPSGNLMKAIEIQFASFNNFKSLFSEAARNRFGSGWAWLYADAKSLKIASSANQDNPLMDVSDLKGFPLLGLDVWEHAYYLKYQNRRGDYIDNWWKIVNWDYIAQRFAIV